MIRSYLPKELSDFSTFAGVDKVKNLKTEGARVLWANYKLLRNDFPFLEKFDDASVRVWLIDHFSSVSDRQFLLQGLRTSKVPRLRDGETTAYRQRYHGRGDFLPVVNPEDGSHSGFIDRKGSGIHYKHLDRNPVLLGKHGQNLDAIRKTKKTNGLLYIGQALRELHMNTVDSFLALREQQSGCLLPGTVGNYAIIQLPFGIYFDENGAQLPSALVLRQANVGRVWLPQYLFPETVNINGATFFGDVVDAGSFLFKDEKLFPFFKESWVKDPQKPKGQTGLPGYKVLLDLVQQVLTSSDPQDVIDQHICSMGQNLPERKPMIEDFGTLDSNLERVTKAILDSPFENASFLQAFHFLKRRDQNKWLSSPLLSEAIQNVLSLDKSHQTIDGFGNPQTVRSLAVPLLALLPKESIEKLILQELDEPTSSNQIRILSEYSWLLPYDSFKRLIYRLVKLNPEHFVQSLTVKLLEPDILEYPQLENLKKMSSMALSWPETRKLALEAFIQLAKQDSKVCVADLTSGIQT